VVSRRTFLLAALASTAARGVASARAASEATPLRIPISFAVATQDDQPVRDAAWIDLQLAEMQRLYGPLGVHPESVSIRSIAPRYAHMETRADRYSLLSEARPDHAAHVFVVGTLRDVDDPTRLRRGVHWRHRANASARYVILASEAPVSVLAHEMGHYFGLGHSAVTDNLMSYDRTGAPVFLDANQSRVIQAAAREVFRSGELVGL